MGIFLRLLFTLPVFLFTLAIRLIQAIITNNNPDNHSDLLIIIHDMCNAHKKVLTEFNYSKKTVPHNTFYAIVNKGCGQVFKKLVSQNTNT
jgi:hypothetical protein